MTHNTKFRFVINDLPGYILNKYFIYLIDRYVHTYMYNIYLHIYIRTYNIHINNPKHHFDRLIRFLPKFWRYGTRPGLGNLKRLYQHVEIRMIVMTSIGASKIRGCLENISIFDGRCKTPKT